MPVTCEAIVSPISQEMFGPADYRIMREVFAIHKELGRFCDEGIYQNELAHRCREMGCQAATEVPIHVSYQSFLKTYYLDLLINGGAIYELKTASSLAAEHRKQALNYLMLTGLHHGKLINWRPASVEHEYVSTQLTPKKRQQFTVCDDRWRIVTRTSQKLKSLILELVTDWGGFLDVQLFYEAVVHFLGGESEVVKQVEIRRGTRMLGTQRAHLIDDAVAFRISAVTKDNSFYEQHLRRFLQHTPLQTIQWINFNHHVLTFKTITRK